MSNLTDHLTEQDAITAAWEAAHPDTRPSPLNILEAAERLSSAALLLTAYAQGRFRMVTPEDAWLAGFDCDAATSIFDEDEGCTGLLEEDGNRILMIDAEGTPWTIVIATGEMSRI
jgi:hypothetical protein